MKKSLHSEEKDVADPTCTKIYYSSRTHSQLSQVVHELEKLNIKLSPASVIAVHETPNSRPIQDSPGAHIAKRRIGISDEEDDEIGATLSAVDVRAVSLGSRKQLCINEKVKLKSGDLDEACRVLLTGTEIVSVTPDLPKTRFIHREG